MPDPGQSQIIIPLAFHPRRNCLKIGRIYEFFGFPRCWMKKGQSLFQRRISLEVGGDLVFAAFCRTHQMWPNKSESNLLMLSEKWPEDCLANKSKIIDVRHFKFYASLSNKRFDGSSIAFCNTCFYFPSVIKILLRFNTLILKQAWRQIPSDEQ